MRERLLAALTGLSSLAKDAIHRSRSFAQLAQSCRQKIAAFLGGASYLKA
jgi:hypothetical protein